MDSPMILPKQDLGTLSDLGAAGDAGGRWGTLGAAGSVLGECTGGV
jgi:hypothetical protein